MITTTDIKRQLKSVFTIGSDRPTETVLIIGSCRSVAYLNYIDRANRSIGIGQCWRIHFIDPWNYHWDGNEPESAVDYEAAINALENDPRILEILRSTTIYIHEYYDSFGMFNSSRTSPKNIYQFGLAPRLDICIPNFNDVAILGHPKEVGEASLEKFYGICRQTDFPEMEQHFRDNWRSVRFFWAPNHVSRFFTMFIFQLMNAKFLHLSLDVNFWREASKEDLFAATPAPVSQADRDNYQLTWP